LLYDKLVNGVAAGAATALLFSAVAAAALEGPQSTRAHAVQPLPPRLIRATFTPSPVRTFAVPNTVTAKASPALSVFQSEQRMSFDQLMKRWNPMIKKAAKRFGVPVSWIREVMRIESGGRTMMAENVRMVSSQGALGLMQIEPGTYAEMRSQYRLGPDPFDPHDNIFAGAAYLRWLRGKYGYPTMFEAYDDGPGNLEQRLTSRQLLPAETQNYVNVVRIALGDKPKPAAAGASLPSGVNAIANGATAGSSVPANGTAPLRTISFGAIGAFTRSDGSTAFVDCTLVRAVRAPLLNEYAPEVKSVITVGAVNQGVQETEEVTRQVVLSHGGKV